MRYVIYVIMLLCTYCSVHTQKNTITIAILAKDKAHTLPEYLRCIEHQTWPKKQTNLYVRTNNNTDKTVEILKTWLARVQHEYKEIYFDDADVREPVEKFGQHEWNATRFKVLGAIRQDSVRWAHEKGSHYFVADCDNLIKPHVLETLYKTGLPIVAPLLKKEDCAYYSNYHAAIDENGYFVGSPLYYMILNQELKGIIQVPVVHCTYFVRHEYLTQMCYDDNSYRYEYVIFSERARKKSIPQYIDNRQVYGRITMAESRHDFVHEPWFSEILNY